MPMISGEFSRYALLDYSRAEGYIGASQTPIHLSFMPLVSLFETNLSELNAFKLKFHGTVYAQYAEAVKSYWTNDLPGLGRAAESFEKTDLSMVENRIILALIKLREEIRADKISIQRILDLEELLPDGGAWLGEMHFVLGMAYEDTEQEKVALVNYESSEVEFYRIGAMQRSVKSRYNAYACKSRISPQQIYICELTQILTAAEACNAQEVVAGVLANLSREYQLRGAMHVAFDYVTRAIRSLQGHAFGSLQYYFAICNRCEIALHLGYAPQAITDLEEAWTSDRPEIRFACDALTKLFEVFGIAIPDSLKSQNEIPKKEVKTWSERLEPKYLANLSTQTKLSDLEEKVLMELARGAQSKDDLMESIYGNAGSYFDRENRFKQLMFRLRKKQKGMIAFHHGKYSLV